MPTIIAKKIRAKPNTGQKNLSRTKNLIEYITNPENERGKEKCTVIQLQGFSDTDLTNEEILQELDLDISLAHKRHFDLMSHWIISWSDKNITPEQAFSAADDLLKHLGYTDEHKKIYAFHEDTDNAHVHIAACKVEQWTGRILSEGWWKNESQKALVKIAKRNGWELEKNHKFTDKAKEKKNKISQGAKAKEIFTGETSEETKLQKTLENFIKEHEKDLQKWKFAKFHEELAKIGVECKRVEPKRKKYGIIFSLDGQIFCKASIVCPEMTYEKLLEKTGKSWRDARPETQEILKEVRKNPQQPEKTTKKKEINKNWWKFKEKPHENYINITEIISKKHGGKENDQGRSQKADHPRLEQRTARKTRLR